MASFTGKEIELPEFIIAESAPAAAFDASPVLNLVGFRPVAQLVRALP